ncbi:MAG: hypothetical protein EA370_10815 [Wenzhouxiangella sp.]|nr:MAG: hypothetical protein EA370_10815 [Wenzhouxiangella sp.]
MNTCMQKTILILIAIAVLLMLASSALADTTITYQGQLEQGSQPHSGTPGMVFRLYDSLTGGNQIGDDEFFSSVPVSEGLFQVELDFGAGAFGGGERFLEIEVSGTTLSPRQKITGAPTAQHALEVAAGAVGSSALADQAVTPTKLSDMGAAAGQVLKWDGSAWQPAEDEMGGGAVEFVTEGGNTGLRRADADPAHYGDIGDGAVDLSRNTSPSTTRGATGLRAFAMGGGTTASGTFSTAMGDGTTASGFTSTAMGHLTVAAGWMSTAMGNGTIATSDYSIAMGVGTRAESYAAMAVGRNNVGGGSSNWVSTDPLFEIGNGTSGLNRSNAFTVLKNGLATLPSVTNALIDGDASGKAVVTREWVNANMTEPGGLLRITEGGNFGYRRANAIPSHYGDIGDEAVDLSWSGTTSSTRGATGFASTAMGSNTTASGDTSTATGRSTIASGQYSVAMGSSTIASNSTSTAFGWSTEASGVTSTALGRSTTASGLGATAMGQNTRAESHSSVAIGRFNLGGGNVGVWWATDPLFEIGNGSSDTNRSNAFTVLKNGLATLPSVTNVLIDGDATGKAVVTREWVNANMTEPGLRQITEGGNTGYRRADANPANYGNIGLGAMDLSWSSSASTTLGATQSYATAMGDRTTASGYASTAMGAGSYAESLASVAIGRNNVGGGSATSWTTTDPLFEIGIGGNPSARANAMTVLKNGRVGLQSIASPTYALHLPNSTTNGVGRALANQWATYSDERVKTDRKELSHGLAAVLQLNPQRYFHHDSVFQDGVLQRQDGGSIEIGFIAQEVHRIIPEAVSVPEDESVELWGMSYDKLVPILVKAIQEQQLEFTIELAARDEQIAQLQDQLERQRDDIELRLSALESLPGNVQIAGNARSRDQ